VTGYPETGIELINSKRSVNLEGELSLQIFRVEIINSDENRTFSGTLGELTRETGYTLVISLLEPCCKGLFFDRNF